jgi:hypothetical protein
MLSLMCICILPTTLTLVLVSQIGNQRSAAYTYKWEKGW